MLREFIHRGIVPLIVLHFTDQKSYANQWEGISVVLLIYMTELIESAHFTLFEEYIISASWYKDKLPR